MARSSIYKEEGKPNAKRNWVHIDIRIGLHLKVLVSWSKRIASTRYPQRKQQTRQHKGDRRPAIPPARIASLRLQTKEATAKGAQTQHKTPADTWWYDCSTAIYIYVGGQAKGMMSSDIKLNHRIQSFPTAHRTLTFASRAAPAAKLPQHAAPATRNNLQLLNMHTKTIITCLQALHLRCLTLAAYATTG